MALNYKGKRHVHLLLEPEDLKEARKLAADEDISVSELFSRALKVYKVAVENGMLKQTT
jgi:hypothetical protein